MRRFTQSHRGGGSAQARLSVDVLLASHDALVRDLAAAQDALRGLLSYHDWMVFIGGTEGPIAQEHILEAAKRHMPLIDAARAAIASAKGERD